MEFQAAKLHWIHPPRQFSVTDERIEITTEPGTDYWQRTYYGFRNDNAHTLVMPVAEDFSFTVKTQFDSKTQYDQCGIILYQNSDNWFKASIEYENETYQRLGSVVTNQGYSDWATADIPAGIRQMVYRLSRRGADFRVENSLDGEGFAQMRIFHFSAGQDAVNLGIYACSPLQSSFHAVFTEMRLTGCVWEAYRGPENS
ncbi:hypothetical protein EDC14_1003123 [Hydrogenispora ethanolica]|uniref:DUF1349 domain-containing protein n=1 Tax=Hydrogenispora ethanolica TaxID=1082276 RepID=A0A4R1S796_HYDET|nr:DUF1349 domain-containing protein [Hydrogenispora ethanolica]TCL75191.1 hypothetical protein EDC14_1003123 [Hydrogenispora ethanolica]